MASFGAGPFTEYLVGELPLNEYDHFVEPRENGVRIAGVPFRFLRNPEAEIALLWPDVTIAIRLEAPASFAYFRFDAGIVAWKCDFDVNGIYVAGALLNNADAAGHEGGPGLLDEAQTGFHLD